MSENHEHQHHILSIKTAGIILVLLLLLTGTTVAVSRIDLGFLNVAVALTLAVTKALLVILFFMHMKYENRFMQMIVFLCFLLLAIFIGMTFFDLAYRGG
ncbi:cytochrome C oxidase subunit IV family protein [Seleniivibrio sp.]|uniref:cytochrome C oxidase subunit IV family protein n=1 Tax=Seleniivibrio sp. TaxID=2898801 RepID=UPI0025E008FC|nr:cytochrome C oxidase subunit IV family protein [Seleniivibrio sp.]MCD8554857.1 cytochrome C oxidase subunit IV family protein [Seleniivibrio sp.]